MSHKYIVVELDGKEQIFVFPKLIAHDHMLRVVQRVRIQSKTGDWAFPEKVISAGFIDGGHCHGRSGTLNIESRPIDTALLGMVDL